MLTPTWRKRATLGLIALALCAASGVAILRLAGWRPGKETDRPDNVLEWKSHGGRGFLEWGRGGKFIYGTSGEPQVLDVWEWRDGRPTKSRELPFPLKDCFHVSWTQDERCFFTGRPVDEGDKWPFCLIRADRPDQTTKLAVPDGWDCKRTQPSANGMYVGVCLKDDSSPHPPGYDFDHPRLQVGLIAPGTTEITWGATLVAKGEGSFDPASVAPSDDGRYVAVGNWGWGVALIDVEAQRELWTRVPGSNSVEYVAFSPDSKVAYAGGTEAAVYAMDVQTGNVLNKWYASKSGQEEYGHCITCLAVSPDGRWVAAGTGPEGLVFVGSTATNRCVRILNHGGNTTLLVHFSPDSKALATFAAGTLKIWNVLQWDTLAGTAPAQTQAAATQRATSRGGTGR